MNKKQVKTRKWLGIILALAMVIGMMPTAAFADDHVHEYVETVVEPTCTEQGYTLHKCSCGDEYKDSYTDPVPHDYGEDGYCTYGCGNYRAVAPEGSEFLYVEAKGKVTISPQDDIRWGGNSLAYTHIIISEGTKTVKITYPKDSIYADEVYKTTQAKPWDFARNTYGGSFNPPAFVNEDGTITVTIPVSDYVNEIPGIGTGVGIGDVNRIFTFEYALPEGYYHVYKPTNSTFIFTGEDIATNGYTFTVEPIEGYTPSANLQIIVNDDVVATKTGEITIPVVDKDLHIIIKDQNVSVIVDLSKLDSETYIFQYNHSYVRKTRRIDGESEQLYINDGKTGITLGDITDVGFSTAEYKKFEMMLRIQGKSLAGWNVNGTYYGIQDAVQTFDDEDQNYRIKILKSSNRDGALNLILGLDDDYLTSGNFMVKPIIECAEHDWAPATCMEPETCTKCNMPKEGSTPDTENGHAWDEGEVTKEATIGAAGEMTYRCEHNAAHTKKEEIPQVDATELNELISDAETKAAEEIAISENGEGLDIGTKFVSQSDKDAFDAAIAAAKTVVSSDDSTESDVYDAYLALGEAIDEYDWSTQVLTDLMDAENKVDALPKEIKTSDKEAVEAARKALEAVDKEAETFDQDYYDYVETKLGAAEAKLDAAEAKEELDKVKKDADASKEAEKQAAEKAAKAEEAQKAAEKKLAEAENALKNAKTEKVGKVALKKVKGAKKKVTVTWKKVNGAKGYEVIVAKNKKGTKNALTYNVKGNKAKKVVKKLKKGKYFVKVRAYKQYNGEMLYGGWSKAKKVKVK